MIRSLEEIQLTHIFIDSLKDVNQGVFVQVVCGKQLILPTPLPALKLVVHEVQLT